MLSGTSTSNLRRASQAAAAQPSRLHREVASHVSRGRFTSSFCQEGAVNRSPKWLWSPRALVVLVAALGTVACSESPDQPLGPSGPTRVGGVPSYSLLNVCDFSDLYDGTNPLGSVDGSNVFGAQVAATVQLRAKGRSRFELVGDAGQHSIGEALGLCAAPPAVGGVDVPPTVFFTRGHAKVVEYAFDVNTGARIESSKKVILDSEFGPLLFPGNALESGVVVANDAAKNVLEIVWPGLAGTGGPGAQPIVRVQLQLAPSYWSASAPYRVDIEWNMDATDALGAIMHLRGRMYNHDLNLLTPDVTEIRDLPLDGSSIHPGGSNAAVACPATSKLGISDGTVIAQTAGLVQNRVTKRLRFEVIGDVVGSEVRNLEMCAATALPAAAPTVTFTGGDALITVRDPVRGTVWLISQGKLTFATPLLFPGFGIEDGVVVTNDAKKNVLEIIWPDLAAGGVPGSPIFRVQLADFANSGNLKPGFIVHFEARYNGTAAGEANKTFTVIQDFKL